MKKQDIINAYIRIRKIDNTIPDDVLDFMKNAALERLSPPIKEVLPKCTEFEIDERASKQWTKKMKLPADFSMNPFYSVGFKEGFKDYPRWFGQLLKTSKKTEKK